MIIRVVKPQEEYMAQAVSAISFESSADILKAKKEQEEMTSEQVEEKLHPVLPENPLPSEKHPEITWGAFTDDEKTVTSVVSVSSYTVRFDGHTCLMSGIGGVSTLPHHRRGGGVRECMRAAINDMHEKGYAFSYLYPFKRSYYRQFGYELCCEQREYTVDFKEMKKFDVQGSVEMLLPGSDFSVLTDIYNRHYEKFNLSSVRRDYDKSLNERNILDEKRYVYVWKNKDNVPMGYMIFVKNNGYMDCTMNFWSKNDFAAVDTEAYMGLLNFAQGFAADYKGIKLQLPEGLNITGIITEMNGASYTARYPGMARVIDVKAVLEMAKARGEGELVLEIRDSFAPWNDGRWLVKLSKNGNKAERTDREPDMTMDINSFTYLICGCGDFEDTAYMPAVKVINKEMGEALFYRKKSAVLDLF